MAMSRVFFAADASADAGGQTLPLFATGLFFCCLNTITIFEGPFIEDVLRS
jgi:hypothetical protein